MLEPLTETKAIVLLTDQLADAHRDLTAARMRIAELEAALRSVLSEWEPTRDDYRADLKGLAQFYQARDIHSAAFAVLNKS